MTMSIGLLILAGVGIWWLIEGLLIATMPDAVQRLARYIAGMSHSELAISGGVAAIIGLGLLVSAVWLA